MDGRFQRKSVPLFREISLKDGAENILENQSTSSAKLTI